MPTLARALLAEIEAFQGNSVTLKTADRVRAFMRAQAPAPPSRGGKARAPAALAQAPGAGPMQLAAATGVSCETGDENRITLIIGGGIAAYKCLELIRRLREHRVAVRTVMTRAAQAFLTPLAVGALSGDRVFTELFDLDEEREIGHIRLSREADLIVVAPATADLLAKMAGGHADDLASCVLLASDKPVLLAPAMNPRMWLNAATRRNVALLEADGVRFVGPAEGEMAEAGEAGPGRLVEVPELLAAIADMLGRSFPSTPAATHDQSRRCPSEPPAAASRRATGPLSGRHVV